MTKQLLPPSTNYAAGAAVPVASLSEEQASQAFHLEQRGIGYVPPEDRYLRPRRLSWMWSASVLNVTSVLYGSLLIGIGLSLLQAVIVTIVATFGSFLVLGVTSLGGPRAGTNQLTISRAAFGYNWNRFNAFFNWVLIVGFEVVGLSVIVLAGTTLLGQAGMHSSTLVKTLVILVVLAIQLPIPLLGHATVVKVMRPLAVLLAAFFVVMAILLIGKLHPGAYHHQAGFGDITVAIALIMGGAGLGWCAYGSDYTRYIADSVPKRQVFWAVTLGPAIPQTLLTILGAAVTTTIPNASDQISGLPHAFPGWFVTPYLLLAMVSLFAVNAVNLYSSGLNLQTIGITLQRWQAVCVDLVISGLLTFLVIFSQRFNTLLSDFLLFSLVWIVPWVSVYLVDWVLRSGQYDVPALFSRNPGGVYWRKDGVNLRAVAAQLLGMAACLLWLNAYPVYQGPLSKAFGGSDLNIFAGAVVAAGAYFILARETVREESAQTETSEADVAGMETVRV